MGTKLVLAQILDRHETVGQDLVAMCVNDILASGAEPLFFLDYIAIGHIEAEHMAKIVKGVADGCKLSAARSWAARWPSTPGVMRPDDYDLAGFAVGVVDRPKMLDPANVRPGDVILGLPSTGVHSNGYSLVRKVISVDGVVPGTPEAAAKKAELESIEVAPGLNLADALLAPTRIYNRYTYKLLRSGVPVHALAHITGGGITENLTARWPPTSTPWWIAVAARWVGTSRLSSPTSPNQAELAPNEACKTFKHGRGPVHHLRARGRGCRHAEARRARREAVPRGHLRRRLWQGGVLR